MIVGVNGPAVELSAETALWLETTAKLTVPRSRLRGVPGKEHVYRELLELREVAMSFRPRKPEPEEIDRSPEVDAGSDQQWLPPCVAAELLGMTDRAVRLACQQGRLDAERVGGRWQITRQAITDYQRTKGKR